MLKMDCGARFNGWEFKVGRKYLTVENIITGKKERMELTECLVDRLKAINANYAYGDAAMTEEVLEVFEEYKLWQ